MWKDNEVIAYIRSIIIDHASQPAFADLLGMPIAQAFQPTQQGVPSGPSAFIYKIGPSVQFGWPLRSDKWDAENSKMIHTETQQLEGRFQITTLSPQNAADEYQLTASDLLEFIISILQNQATIEKLQKINMGIQRVTESQNPQFLDDRAQNEAAPSFDFILSYKKVIITETPIINTREFQIKPV